MVRVTKTEEHDIDLKASSSRPILKKDADSPHTGASPRQSSRLKVKRASPVPKNEQRLSRVRSPTPQERVKKENKIKDNIKAHVKGKAKGKAKAKTPKNVFDAEFRLERLKRAGIPESAFNPVGVDQATRDSGVVPRYFMSETYGGNPCEAYPRVSAAKFAEHGYDDFMFLAYDRHPEAPRIPGQHGLFLQLGIGETPPWTRGIMRLFTRVSDKPARWHYHGQYALKPALSMTKEEFKRQSPIVKEKWIADFYGYGFVRALVVHQRTHPGAMPTEDEESDILQRGEDKSVTLEEVGQAFKRGAIKLMVYTMQCVAYDANFQREVIEKSSTWTPKRLRDN
ncbi:hypothetical protein NMY22_g358 [Coprinellus aureogranulatus]|nr:hypothetical protein NMY22_g358 [Coprinellus aureogranulatus]